MGSWSVRVSVSSAMETMVRATEQEVGKDVALEKIMVANIDGMPSCLVLSTQLLRRW